MLGGAAIPAIDAVLTIDPPRGSCLLIIFDIVLSIMKAPVTLISIIFLKSLTE